MTDVQIEFENDLKTCAIAMRRAEAAARKASTKSSVMASGPTTLHAQPGAAATPDSHSPHQNRISPR